MKNGKASKEETGRKNAMFVTSSKQTTNLMMVMRVSWLTQQMRLTRIAEG